MQDISVTINAPAHINAYLDHVPKQILSGFRVPEYSIFRQNYARKAIRAAGIIIGDLMMRRSMPDIIHETYYSPYRLGPRKVKRILTIYDMIHEKFREDSKSWEQTKRFKAIAAKRADHVICISKSTRRDAIEYLDIDPNKTSIVYLGFGLNHGSKELKEDNELSLDQPFILYVGNRNKYKNFIRLLKAYSHSSFLKSAYTIICFGGSRFSKEEIDAFRKYGIGCDKIRQVSGNDYLLYSLYKKARAFVYPSLCEGFGIPPLEAMSCSCPVVCSNTSSIPEVVGNAGEFFNPECSESIRLAIERVVASDDLRYDLVERGHERLKFFSWDRCAGETLKIYKTLA